MLRELNPWWSEAGKVRLRRHRGLIEIVRGPRQVGKTPGIHQIIQDLIRSGTSPRDILFIRFDLELLREWAAALRSAVQWFEKEVRGRPLTSGRPAYVCPRPSIFDGAHAGAAMPTPLSTR